MDLTWILAALTTGLIGSLHCVGMCGPLAMALPVGRLPQSQRSVSIGLYHVARITAYAGIGAIAGSIGYVLLLTGFQQILSIGAGLFLLIWTLVLRGRSGGLATTSRTRWVAASMTKLLQQPSWRTFPALGFLNGLLPCGFVYVALAGAITTGHAGYSAIYMMLFGLGTVPALLAIRLVPSLFPVRSRQRLVRLMPVMTVALGLLFMIRGLYLPVHADTGRQPIPICHSALRAAK
ncbi:sulfite exporter TauE/SafE family protein [Spirosoma flavus]